MPKGGFMKKFIFILVFYFMNLPIIHAKEQVAIVVDDTQKVKQLAEKYKKECSEQAYPSDYDNQIYALMDDSLKFANQKYHQCLKKIITDKISDFSSTEDKKAMLQSLDEFQKGVLNFYWTLHNMEDNGFIGRQQNDAILGRYYEQILEDIIQYEQNLQYY